MNSIKVDTPSKINFGLYITGKRSDGYHDLETLFYPIFDLFDTLTITKSETERFTCNVAALQNDENIVLKAKRQLEKLLNTNFNISIDLVKNIPHGGGLGGGSSDAAAFLIGMNSLFDLNLSISTLQQIALTLGSDVPYFLNPGFMYGRGRGEILDTTQLTMNKFILLVKPPILVSTKEAFSNIKPLHRSFDVEIISKMLICEDWSSIRKIISNDFEKTIFASHPEIENIKNIMNDFGALYSSMTGTGSTVYGIYESISDAERTANKFDNDYFKFISRPPKV